MSVVATDLVIKQLCKETGEPGFHNYTTIEGYMLDAIRDMNIFTMPVWSTKLLPISSFNTYDWPCDCIKPLVTALKRNGHFYLLEISEDLLSTVITDTAPEDDSDCDVSDLFQIDGYIEAYGWNVYNWGLGELYGAETLVPPFGVVIHDKKQRLSYIKRCKVQTGDQIVSFYKSDGLEVCPEFIPGETKEVAELFVLQKYFRTRNPNLSAEMDDKYKQRLFRLERLYGEGTIEDWVRAVGSNSKSSPKF